MLKEPEHLHGNRLNLDPLERKICGLVYVSCFWVLNKSV